MSDDLLICQGCFRAGQRCVPGSLTRIVTTRKTSRENGDPSRILSRYDDHLTSINNWSREHVCQKGEHQSYPECWESREIHIANQRYLEVYEQLENHCEDQKKNRKTMFDVFMHIKIVWRWSVTFWCRVNRRHKSTKERLTDTITFKNRNGHWSVQSIHTHEKIFKCVHDGTVTKKCVYEAYRISQSQSLNYMYFIMTSGI